MYFFKQYLLNSIADKLFVSFFLLFLAFSFFVLYCLF